MSEEPRDTDVEVERIENHIFAINRAIRVTFQKINIQNSQI